MLLSSVCSNRISNWSSNLYPARSSPSACSRPVVAAAATATLCQSAADIKQLQLVTDSASHAGSLYCPSADDPTSPVTTGHHLLAAVAGAAAVATAGAELQTEALPVHFISDSSNISITACAAAFNNSNTPRSSKSNINSKVSRLSVKESRLLTRRISNSGSLQELLQLHTAQGQQFNIIHVSAVLSKVGKLLRDDPAAVPAVADGQQQLQQMLHQLEKLSLQLMADVQQPASIAVLRSVGNQLLVQQISAGPEQHSQQLHVQPQQLSTIAWGYATASYQPSPHWWSTYFGCSTPILPTYNPHELATAIWAAAKLQQHPPASWMKGFLDASSTGLAAGGFGPQEMCMMLWGLVQLGIRVDGGWWRCLQHAVSGCLSSLKPRDIAQVLWAHARLQASPPKPWLAQVLAAATAAAAPQQLQRYSGRDTAMLLWALAALQQQQQQQHHQEQQHVAVHAGNMQQQNPSAGSRQQPPQQQHAGHIPQQVQAQQEQQQMLLERLLQGLQLSNCKLAACLPQDYAHILWSLTVLAGPVQQQQQQQQLPWDRAVAHGPNPQLQHQQHLSSAAWSPDPPQQRQQGMFDIPGPHSVDSVQQHMYSTESGAHDLCIVDSHGTHSSSTITTSSSSSQPSSSSTSSSGPNSNTIGINQQLLQSWTNLTWRYTQAAASDLGPTDAAQLLWAASQLGLQHYPDESWMRQFWNVSRRQMQCYNAQALTVTVWSAHKMGYKPPVVWMLAAVPILQQQLADLQPAAACQLLYVLAKLQHRPSPDFMQQLLSRLQLDAHQLQPRAFACVLWSLGRLGYQPGVTWWSVILHHLSESVNGLGERELRNIAWGLSELEVRWPEGLGEQLQQRMLEMQQQ